MKKVSLFIVIILLSVVTFAQNYESKRIQLSGKAEVYLVIEGNKCQIPNAEIYSYLFRDWNGIVQLDQTTFNTIPLGGTLGTDTKKYSRVGGSLSDGLKTYNLQSGLDYYLARHLDGTVEDEGEADEEGSEN